MAGKSTSHPLEHLPEIDLNKFRKYFKRVNLITVLYK